MQAWPRKGFPSQDGQWPLNCQGSSDLSSSHLEQQQSPESHLIEVSKGKFQSSKSFQFLICVHKETGIQSLFRQNIFWGSKHTSSLECLQISQDFVSKSYFCICCCFAFRRWKAQPLFHLNSGSFVRFHCWLWDSSVPANNITVSSCLCSDSTTSKAQLLKY